MPTRIFPLILVLFIAILPFAIYRGTPAVFASFKRCFVSLGWNPLSRANKLPACWKAIGQKKGHNSFGGVGGVAENQLGKTSCNGSERAANQNGNMHKGAGPEFHSAPNSEHHSIIHFSRQSPGNCPTQLQLHNTMCITQMEL